MEITRREHPEYLELVVTGRLDAHWADYFADELGAVIREGSHQIHLDFSELRYLSSAGIGVLLRFYKELTQIDGSLVVKDPSEAVRSVLDIVGLSEAFLAAAAAPPKAEIAASIRTWEREGLEYELFEEEEGSETITCKLIGDPARLKGCRFDEAHSHPISLSGSEVALGLGALGSDFGSCRNRFGEFLAVAGSAIYQPTDGTGSPDYLVSAGEGLLQASFLYGLVLKGNPLFQIRFAISEGPRSVQLTPLISEALESTELDSAAFVIVSESTGLIGAALKSSPALEASPQAPFEYPEIRRWLSFTPERIHTNSVCLVVGIATRRKPGDLAPFVRPLASETGLQGHFHAAAFSYGPLKRGKIDLRETVSMLFETERPEGVLHLFPDNRPVVGVGESEFSRGACWLGPLASPVEDKRP